MKTYEWPQAWKIAEKICTQYGVIEGMGDVDGKHTILMTIGLLRDITANPELVLTFWDARNIKEWVLNSDSPFSKRVDREWPNLAKVISVWTGGELAAEEWKEVKSWIKGVL